MLTEVDVKLAVEALFKHDMKKKDSSSKRQMIDEFANPILCQVIL